MQVRRVLDAVRQPEYTGENRCVPCTVVNLGLVAGGALALGALAAPAAGADAAVAAGGAVVLLGVAAVYFRGYVVPGTPTLTKRYLPERVLAWFDHAPAPDVDLDVDDADPERALVAAGALEPCPRGDDLCLDSLFRASWRAEMPRFAGDLEAALDELLPPDVDADAAVDEREAAVAARVDDVVVAEWPSRAAFVADAAGAAVLRDRDPAWHDRSFAAQTRLLAGLRLWLDECSVCGGDVRVGEETVESCCRSRLVVAATCTSCGARVFEAPYPDEN